MCVYINYVFDIYTESMNLEYISNTNIICRFKLLIKIK